MIHRVPNHVNQRIPQLLHDIPIQFRVLALQQKLHLLLLLRRQIPHEPGHFLKSSTDWDHPQGHRIPL